MINNNQKEEKKKPNQLIVLAINIVIPAIIMTRFSGDESLGPRFALVVALLFPLFYGLFEFYKERSFNFISALGIFSILATGSIGLLKLPPQLVAIKEAGVPFVIGLFVLVSLKTPFPLVKKLLYNENVMNIDKVNTILKERSMTGKLEKLLTSVTILIASSFFLSAILNYALAKYVVVSDPGTSEFTSEIGRMTALSYPVIVLPSMVVLGIATFVLLHGLHKLTGLEFEEIFSPKKSSG